MDLETLLSFDWGVMMPEFIILGVATLLTLCDLFMPKEHRSENPRLDWVRGHPLAALVSLLGLLDHGM